MNCGSSGAARTLRRNSSGAGLPVGFRGPQRRLRRGRPARRRTRGTRRGVGRRGVGRPDDRRTRARDRHARGPREPRGQAAHAGRGPEVGRTFEPAPAHPGDVRRCRRPTQADRLQRAPGHAELPGREAADAVRARGFGGDDPRRHAPRGTAQGPGGVHPGSERAGAGRDRRRGRRHQPAACPPDGQLRPAVEPEPDRAAIRAHPPDRPDRGVPPVEPGRRGHQGRRRSSSDCSTSWTSSAAHSAARCSTSSAKPSRTGRCGNC